MDTLTCPYCNATSPAEDWIIEGSCEQIVKVSLGELEITNDDQPTYWFHGATCPQCDEYFEFLDTVKLEWYEPLSKLYPRVSEQLRLLQKAEKRQS